MVTKPKFESEIFRTERVPGLGGEWIVRGGRHLFRHLPRALSGVRQIGVIGWGSQAPAQALNLRESLGQSPIRVVVGLRAGSRSLAEARIFPAIDIPASGTRKEAKLYDDAGTRGLATLRRVLSSYDQRGAMDSLFKLLRQYPTNAEFLASMGRAG